MRISAALPPGVEALLFESAARRRAIENRLLPLLEGRGYGEAILPVVDYADPYQHLLDERQRGELYRFVDRDGELLALRGDFTPLLARILAPRSAVLPKPLRIYYRGDVVRYGAARSGHRREFYQLGAELLGVGGESAEREILELFAELLAAGGAPIRIVLSFAGALDQALAGCPDPAAMGRAVARRERATARLGSEPLLEVVEEGVPRSSASLGAAGERLQRLLDLVESLRPRFPSLDLRVDLAEFADLSALADAKSGAAPRSYYDGIVFRAYGLDSAQPLGAGGRYDGLFRALGADLPAVGFSLSVDRLGAGDSA